MEKLLYFISLLRNAGIRISISETIDAYNALLKVSIINRDVCKSTLLCTLIKSNDDVKTFYKIFDLFFTIIEEDNKLDDKQFEDIINDLHDKMDNFESPETSDEDNESDTDNESDIDNQSKNDKPENDNKPDEDSQSGTDNKSDEDNQSGTDNKSGEDNEPGTNNQSGTDNQSKENLENDFNSMNNISEGNTDETGKRSISEANQTHNDDNSFDGETSQTGNTTWSDNEAGNTDSGSAGDTQHNSSSINGNGVSSSTTTNISTNLTKINNDFSSALQQTDVDDYNRNLYKMGSEAELHAEATRLANLRKYDDMEINDLQATCEKILIKNKLEFGKVQAKRGASSKQIKMIDDRYNKLKEYLKDELEKAIVQQYGLDIINDFMSEDNLYDTDIADFDVNDYDKVDNIIKKMVKKFNTNVSRKYKLYHKGQINIKHTIKKSLQSGTTCSELSFKTKKHDKTKLIILCDVSGSVYDYVPFFLQILKGIQDNFKDIRNYIFVDRIKQIDVNKDISFNDTLSLGYGTDYTNAFDELAQEPMDNKTVLIILGDAENTSNISGIDNFKKLYNKCKTIIWLTPLDTSEWYTSTELKEYEQYCKTVYRCKTMHDLEYFVKALIKI